MITQTPPETVVIEPTTTLDQQVACGDPVEPGDVHEDCVHSLVMHWCCVCAGCAESAWWCGRKPMLVQLHLLWWHRFLHAATWTSLVMIILLAFVGLLDDFFLMMYLWVFLGAFWLLSIVATSYQSMA